jgi:hypothetical protein
VYMCSHCVPAHTTSSQSLCPAIENLGTLSSRGASGQEGFNDFLSLHCISSPRWDRVYSIHLYMCGTQHRAWHVLSALK